jgi:hypothetical protein
MQFRKASGEARPRRRASATPAWTCSFDVGRDETPRAGWQPARSLTSCPTTEPFQAVEAQARISHTPPSDVARALVPAESRLISTRVRGCDRVPHASVGMSADAAGKSACATSRSPTTCEKVGLVYTLHKRLSRSSRSLTVAAHQTVIEPGPEGTPGNRHQWSVRRCSRAG